MMKGLKNYKSSIILFISVLIGGIFGLVMGEDAKIFAPFGDIFLNLILTILVPMVFFSIASAIANIESTTKLGKVLITTVLVFAVTAIIAGVVAIIGFKLFNPTEGIDSSLFVDLMAKGTGEATEVGSLLEKIVASITVKDFSQLLSRTNLLAVVVFSALVGIGTMKAKETGKVFAKFLNSGAVVCGKVIEIIMYYAPIGLAAYFANVIGSLGGQILNGYIKVFILYIGITIIYFFGFFSLYAYVAGKKIGVKSFWKNAGEPSLTAIATCSSAACIPVNIQAAKKMAVSSNLANIIMPIGVNIHKDGSVISGVFKIMFLFGIFGREMSSINTLVIILVVALFTGALVGAIPVGGSIGEILILSIFGFPPEALAIILVIATIVDAPATLLNSAGNTVCTMMVSRFTKDSI